jgi:hypothetical protein
MIGIVFIVAAVLFILFGFPFVQTMPERRMLKELARQWGGRVTLTWRMGAKLVMTYKSHPMIVEVIPVETSRHEQSRTFIRIRLLRGFPLYLLIVRDATLLENMYGIGGRSVSEMVGKRVESGIPDLDNDVEFFCLNESDFRRFLLNEVRKDEISYMLTQDVIKMKFSPKELMVLKEIPTNRDFPGLDAMITPRFIIPLLDSIVKLAPI